MIVVGGSYQEQVIVPALGPRPGGSGVRAAQALGSRVQELVTALAPHEAPAPDLDPTTEVRRVDRDEAIRFEYFTPLSTPRVHGLEGNATHERVAADAQAVLAFGLLETNDRQIRAKQVVVDPQRRDATIENALAAIVADETVLTTNVRELHHMVPGSQSTAQRADELRTSLALSAVVVRAAARGCYVSTARGSAWIDPVPTLAVHPLGSGDTFNAGFAASWFAGATPIEAAETGSRAAAWWCSTQQSRTPESVLAGGPVPDLPNPDRLYVGGRAPRIYLAAPFFTVAERWLVDQCYAWLDGLGARTFSPIHHVGSGGDEVALADIAAVNACDVVFAILDHGDPGTVYEVGWAARAGIPIVGYSSRHDMQNSKMLVGLGAEIHDDLATSLYRAVWVGLGSDPHPGRSSSTSRSIDGR